MTEVEGPLALKVVLQMTETAKQKHNATHS